MVPLFSIASSRSWGVGEFLDLPVFARWLQAAGQSFVQMLPITEIPEHETSPYSALTAMALDPIYISLPALEDFEALGGDVAPERGRPLGARDGAERTANPAPRGASAQRQVAASMRSSGFCTTSWPPQTQRARRFVAFSADEACWLDDYALFQALARRARASRLVGMARAAGAAPRSRARRRAGGAGAPRSHIASTCSGWRRSSGRVRGARPRPRRSSVTCRS